MPPQLTTSTSATEGDAARLRLDFESTRSVLGFLARYWRAYQAWRWQWGPQVTLQDLNDRELMDIGLTRGEIDHFMPERAIDALRDRAMDPWGRGVI